MVTIYKKQCKMDGHGKNGTHQNTIYFLRITKILDNHWGPIIIRTPFCINALVDCRYGIPPPKHPQVATTEAAAVAAAEFHKYSGSKRNKITWAIVPTTSWRLSVNNTHLIVVIFEWGRFYILLHYLYTDCSCICEILSNMSPPLFF